LVTVPQIEEVRVRIVPPEYARQWGAVYDGAVPEEGIRGLRGTKVALWATSNRPLGGGQIVLRSAPLAAGHGAGSAGQVGPPLPAAARRQSVLAMTPVAPGGCEVRGEFEITADAALECRVVDEAGQVSQQTVSTRITLLADQYPFVRILQPEPMALATPTAALPVVLSAEDDCGLSRLQLFRSLNESRPIPAEIGVGAPPPRRSERQVLLPLDRFGLAPGDAIKLFARVEDNDPAGAKGSESQVVTVRIISQEEFDRLLRVRQGIEVLVSRYRESQRRMEALAQEAQELRKKLKQAPPGSPLGPEMREQLRRLEQLMQADAEALAKAARSRLPYDLDEQLSPEIGRVAAMTEAMAQELDKLQKQMDLLPGDLDKKLADMADRLGAERRQFNQEAMEPLEYMEAVFPLLVDQSRFIALALRQKDLAERMAPLEGHDGEDDPRLKARMRDLEYEQAQIREALDELLDDIDDHATRLPIVPELEELRETSHQFAKDVRASGAAEAMRQAEAALSDFRGTRARQKGREAAEILDRFIGRCEGMEGMGKGCLLAFRPVLARGLGNTVAQLLAEMGGSGSGGSSGFGTYGLYGQMSGMSGLGSGEYGDSASRRGDRRGRQPGGGNADRTSADASPAASAATAAGDATVPARYRQRVGQYFQRLAEEINQNPAPRRGR
jgi:hypothetical protein